MQIDEVEPGSAIVTGAGSRRGIGRATARALARAGWNVALVDIDLDGARENAEEIRQTFAVAALAVQADVSDEGSVERAVASIHAELPPVAALVNNAGITAPTSFVATTTAEWDRIFAVNSRGTFLVTKYVFPLMRERKVGRIVNISSMAAQRGGGFGRTAYSASKAAIMGFSNALAREAAPEGILVNTIAPGYVQSDLPAGQLGPEQEAEIISAIPIGRAGIADDVADLVVYLCSPSTGFVTGAVYDINGGAHIH